MKSSFFFMLVISLSIVSCTEQRTNDKPNNGFSSNRASYYPDGRTIQRFNELDENGNENGVYKYYYPNGVLQDSAIMTNGKFHGNRFLYYPNGKLERITNYMNHKFRSGIAYDSLGVLKYYRAYDYFQNLMFIIWYSETGKTQKIDGNFMYSCILEDTIKNFQNYELLVATPPKSKVIVKVYESFDEKTPQTPKYVITPDQFNRVQYTINRFAKKDVSYINIATVYDSISKKQFSDTCIVKITQTGKTSFKKLSDSVRWLK